jgi:hypothetical protein
VDPFAALAAARRRLLDLLAELDAGPAREVGAGRIAVALAACKRDFAALQALGTPEMAREGEPARRWQRELEELLRLNSVCIGRVESEVESLAQALDATRRQRGDLDGLRNAAETGGACDVAG